MNLVEKNSCSGCMACLQACPKHCIKTIEDDQGNRYPVIDPARCIQCMKCRAVCPELNRETLSFNASKKAYAAWSLNEKQRALSASGGVAAEMYRSALDQGYWICGVEYQQNFHVIHTLTNKQDAIKLFQQSKYVYSEIKNVFIEIKSHLDKGEGVLFISLPCKIAGLKSFLGKDYKNLIVVDIVCHGAPPYRQMLEHILSIDKSRNAEKLSFRSDNDFIFKLASSSKTLYSKSVADDEYLAAFINGLNYRNSCYQCKYARKERISDITICDFWGLGKEIPFEHPYTGSISAVLVNTIKGEEFFAKCKETLFVEERLVSEVVQGNTQLRQASKIHSNRDKFLRLYPEVNFEKAVRICLKDEMNSAKLKQIKKQCRNVLRKMMGTIVPYYRD